MRAIFALAAAIWLAALSQSSSPADVPWPLNGGIDNIRYSALTQINRENVNRLQVAWTYDSHDASRGSEMQSNPVVVDGVLYATTPTLKVVAIDAATGKENWNFDPSGGTTATARSAIPTSSTTRSRYSVSAFSRSSCCSRFSRR